VFAELVGVLVDRVFFYFLFCLEGGGGFEKARQE
jgi:hypothetical protein